MRRAPDDDRLIYGIDAGGDERQQLWLFDGASPRALTDAADVIHGFGAWHKDGARFSLTANDRDPAHYDILIQDLATGARTRLHEGRHEMTVGPWHKDGTRLVATEDHATGDQRPFILTLDGVATPIPCPRPAGYGSLRWDGDSLLGLTDGPTGFTALCAIDPATGAVTPVFAPDCREVDAWALSPGGALLATIENDRGYGVLRVGPRDGDRPIVAGFEQGVAADLSWSPDGAKLAFAWSAPERPSGLYLWQDGAVDPGLAAPVRPADPPLPPRRMADLR